MSRIVDQLTSEVNAKSTTIRNLEIELRLLQQTRKIAQDDLAGLAQDKDQACVDPPQRDIPCID